MNTFFLQKVVAELNKGLGSTLVAILSGSRDSKAPLRWEKGQGLPLDIYAEARLYAAHETWQLLSEYESEDIARVWFVGKNPILDESPVVAFRQDRNDDVIAAAQSFVDGEWSG